jgi:hypothetical protein
MDRAEMRDVVLAAGEVVVDAENITTLREQLFAEVRPQKTGAAGDHYFFQASLH